MANKSPLNKPVQVTKPPADTSKNNHFKKVTHSELEELVMDSEFEEDSGDVAAYIPELGTALKEKTGVSVCYLDDPDPIAAGDYNKDIRARPFGEVDQSRRLEEDDMFTIQSISKVFALLYVLDCRGESFVFKRIHKEPTGDPFNADPKTTKSKGGEKRIPFNPMINVGAIFITSLFPEVKLANVQRKRIKKVKGLIEVPRHSRIYRMSKLAIRKIENVGVSDSAKEKLDAFYNNEIARERETYDDKKEADQFYQTRDELKIKLEKVLNNEDRDKYLEKVLDYCNDGKFKMFMDFVRKICNGKDMIVDHAVWESESATGHNNRALAWRMHSDKIFFTERAKKPDAKEEVNFIEDVLSTYFRQCSILVHSNHLAHAAAVIAGGGRYPNSQETPFEHENVDERLLSSVISIMSNCGLYDGSGEFAYRVGLPGKSGVGGGIMCVVPGIAGIAVFSPALDAKGNSARGLHMLERISEKMKYNIFNRARIPEFKFKLDEKELELMLHKVKHLFDPPKDCQPADYIPELSANKSSTTSIAICVPGEDPIVKGVDRDDDKTFSLQSIANLFGLLYVLHRKTEGMVFKYVGKEPSGGSFTEMKWTINGSNGSKLPFNPMINAGAIAIASMIPDKYSDDGRNFNQVEEIRKTLEKSYYPETDNGDGGATTKLDQKSKIKPERTASPTSDKGQTPDEAEYINVSRQRMAKRHTTRHEIIDQLLFIYPFVDFVRKLCGDRENKSIKIDWDLFLSERKTGHNNRSLAWQMNDNKFFDKILARHELYDAREDGVIEDILDVYFQMCSLQVSVEHLAYFAGVLANGGKDHRVHGSGDQILTPREVAIATSMMSTSGLYNESGEFAYHVGIPAKSGVSGAIVGVVPGKLGLAVYSPAVDKKGNSCRGMEILKRISQEEHLSIFRAPIPRK